MSKETNKALIKATVSYIADNKTLIEKLAAQLPQAIARFNLIGGQQTVYSALPKFSCGSTIVVEVDEATHCERIISYARHLSSGVGTKLIMDKLLSVVDDIKGDIKITNDMSPFLFGILKLSATPSYTITVRVDGSMQAKALAAYLAQSMWLSKKTVGTLDANGMVTMVHPHWESGAGHLGAIAEYKVPEKDEHLHLYAEFSKFLEKEGLDKFVVAFLPEEEKESEDTQAEQSEADLAGRGLTAVCQPCDESPFTEADNVGRGFKTPRLMCGVENIQ